MKTFLSFTLFIFCALISLSAHLTSPYDPHTIITFTGEVVKEFTANDLMGVPSQNLVVKTPNNQYLVHTAPYNYLDDNNFLVKPTDIVTVTGSQVQVQGRSMILASEIKKDDQVIRLRDPQGNPLWMTQ